jgi:hypothetical protein
MFGSKFSRCCAIVIAATAVLAQADVASAQVKSDDVTEFVTEDQVKKSEAKDDTLDATLSTAASLSLTSNKDVVGEIDGFSTLFSLGLVGGLSYVNGAHLWQNTLSINESWARTPSLERFVKNNDQLEYESLYSYFLLEWFGPFARFNVETSVFDTTIVTAEAKDYQIARTDGTTDSLTGVTEVPLASSLEPLTLNQSVGLFAEPIRSTPLTWKVRIGAGARETFAEGVLANDDDDATDAIELIELEDVYQGGLEGFTGLEGKLGDGKFTYRLGASALLPFLNNDSQDRTAIELLRWGLSGGLEMAVVEWLGVNYKVNVLKDPQLLDTTQIQNNLLLTFKYTLIEPDTGPEPTPAEQAKKLREEAAEAEAKAAEKREKAMAIEEAQEAKQEEKENQENQQEAEDGQRSSETGTQSQSDADETTD